jgi:hypothetical protein
MFVGKCARDSKKTSILVRDDYEAQTLVRHLMDKRSKPNATKTSDGTLIQYAGEEERAQWLHIRSFVLAYTHICVMEQLARFPIQDVLRVCTDAIFATSIPPAVQATLIDEHELRLLEECLQRATRADEHEGILYWKSQITSAIERGRVVLRYGHWRHKEPGYKVRKEAASWDVCNAGSHDMPPSDAPELPTDTELSLSSKTYLIGQGGSGKTTRAIKTFQGQRVIVLTPSNILAQYHRTNTPGLAVKTYHKFFKLSATEKLVDWNPAKLGQELMPAVIIWDEACMVPTAMLKTFLPFLESRNVQVVMCGDPGQLNPWGDKEGPHAYLSGAWAHKVITCPDDWRATDEKLKALKLRMWMETDVKQLEEFRAACQTATWVNALKQWTPADRWICSTNEIGAKVSVCLLKEHRQRFPTELATIRFSPAAEVKHKYKKQGQQVCIPGTTTMVEAYQGTLAKCPLAAVEAGLPAEWVYAGWGTIHCMQGQTVAAPNKLFIVDQSLAGWLNNAVYTAVSRVQSMDQLVSVIVPVAATSQSVAAKGQAVCHTPSRDHITKRIQTHRVEDKKKGRLCEAYVTAERVIELAQQQCGRCAVCQVQLLFQAYPLHSPQAYSIDRLDDQQGHAAANVRLTCNRCNVRHLR